MTTQTPLTIAGQRAPARAGRRGRNGGGPKAYDFRKPNKLSREHVRVFQMCYELFARRATTLLSTRLRTTTHVQLLSIDQQSYEEYINSLAGPTVMGLMSLEPMPGTGILEFSSGVAMTSIEHLLGGPGGHQPERPMTEIELPLLEDLFTHLLKELKVGYEQAFEMRPQLSTIEYNPQFVQSSAPSDVMIVAYFEIRVGNEECVASLCLPFSSVPKQFRGRNTAGPTNHEAEAREKARKDISEGLEAAPIGVSVTFRHTVMRPEEVVNLQPGDIIPLNHPADAPLSVVAAGITFAHAMPGTKNHRLACLVVDSPKENAP